MATIRQKGPEQWHAQVRRTGWPPITETLRTRKDAEAWARDIETQMDRGIFVDRSAAERTPFGEIIKTSMQQVTEKRPGEASRAAEKSRLERFMRGEPKLCAHAVAHLRPEHFEDYRDRRLNQFVTRGNSKEPPAAHSNFAKRAHPGRLDYERIHEDALEFDRKDFREISPSAAAAVGELRIFSDIDRAGQRE